LGLFPFPGNPMKGPESSVMGKTADTATSRKIACFWYAGAPTSDNATYAPSGLGDLCYDSTNNDLYRCSAYVSTTSHTWTKIVD
jgi:hypothetical protein